ncbi:helix-turn-helix domain-containing protein [Embleya sp. NPDC020630]|uniref:helix-turn-helix domain-containing protein n=1 Tax=Embleya sp. NPDC020630 TaxID=3363979 RepID=UPI0037B74943
MRADAARSRRRILDAALDVFLTRGLDAPLDLIVRQAGIGPGRLYRRLPDREALVRDLTGDLLTRLENVAEAAARRTATPSEAVRRFVHAVADLRTGAAILVPLEGLVVDYRVPGWRRARLNA